MVFFSGFGAALELEPHAVSTPAVARSVTEATSRIAVPDMGFLCLLVLVQWL
jgi:hypothetical protein